MSLLADIISRALENDARQLGIALGLLVSMGTVMAYVWRKAVHPTVKGINELLEVSQQLKPGEGEHTGTTMYDRATEAARVGAAAAKVGTETARVLDLQGRRLSTMERKVADLQRGQGHLVATVGELASLETLVDRYAPGAVHRDDDGDHPPL